MYDVEYCWINNVDTDHSCVFFVTIIGCSAMSVYGAVQWRWCSLLCSSSTLVQSAATPISCHLVTDPPFSSHTTTRIIAHFTTDLHRFNASEHEPFGLFYFKKLTMRKGWRSLIISCPSLLWINWTNCATTTCYKKACVGPQCIVSTSFSKKGNLSGEDFVQLHEWPLDGIVQLLQRPLDGIRPIWFFGHLDLFRIATSLSIKKVWTMG